MADYLHIDPAGGVTAETLLDALIDLGAPRQALTETLAAVPATASLLCIADPGPGRAKVLADPATVTGRDALEQIERAALPPELRQRSQAALRVWLAPATSPTALPAAELGLILAVHAAVFALAPSTITAAPLPLPQGARQPHLGDLLDRLRGTLVRIADLPPEAVSPLGVVLVRTLAEPATTAPSMTLAGHGTGRDRRGVPRITVLAGQRPAGGEPLVLLETNLDDVQPEILATLIPGCLAAGAVDAWLTPALMKKGRPAQLLSALCRPHAAPAVEALLFRETSTLGVRSTQLTRTALARKQVAVDTPWGPVQIKLGLHQGQPVNSAPEFEDCARLATAAGVPLKQVYAAALAAALELPPHLLCGEN